MSTLASSHELVPARQSLFNRISRRLVVNSLSDIQSGAVTLSDRHAEYSFGQDAELQAHLQIRNQRFFRRALLGGTLAVAESYIEGEWDCSDLTSLFRIFARERAAASRFDGGTARILQQLQRFYHWRRGNSRAGSKKNIETHYDLGNNFFRLWLDETMAYSCGIFPHQASSLRDASVEKFDRVCRRLNLRPQDEVLEIGAGWGGFAIHAAQNYGCRVTTTTISREQFNLAQQRVEEAGVADKVLILQTDYRDLSGSFDKLVSIEMIEAVGHRYFDTYFEQCSRLLRPHGAFLLQAIVMPDRNYERYLRSVDFIQRYVFPGGCLPSLGAILSSTGRATDLRVVEACDFAPHYARTLRMWRDAFIQELPAVRRLGYSDKFIRMWTYYLCYCEAAFDESCIGLFQIMFAKPQFREHNVRNSIEPEIAGANCSLVP